MDYRATLRNITNFAPEDTKVAVREDRVSDVRQ